MPDRSAIAPRRAGGSAEPLLQVEGFSYRYPGALADALRDLRLEVGEGEMIVLAGRSGSGKSTLLRAACGLVPHYFGGEVAGELVVAGLDVRRHGPDQLAHSVGFVAQDPESQVVSATVRGEIELPLDLRGEPAAARARAIEEAALALGIPHLLERTTDSLSGGELQRVALAAALVDRPRLILLDEPTSQLDPVAGDELIGLLRRLNEEWGTAIVLSEHRLERCMAATDRVIAMAEGRVSFDGAPSEFLTWSLAADAALATPAARLFDAAGLGPAPASVKDARARLRALGLDRAVGAEAGDQGEPAAGDDAPPRTRSRRPWSRRRRPGPEDEPALELRDAWIEHVEDAETRTAVRGVDLQLRAGEVVALMGRNGAGKSTLLRAAAGVLEVSRGDLAAARGCALLSQSPGDYLVRERAGDELPGAPGRAALDVVGLGWAVDRDPRDLSGGERQRLALAIAIAGRGAGGDPPGLVCLDEPTRGMDRARKDELRALVGDLTRRGAAVLVATHDVEFAAALAERVVLLAGGELIADGPAAEVLAGGWYFATEVSRILAVPGAIAPESGGALLRARLERGAR